ncbi:helix-turn-helix domain-containing protein [Thermopolyspora sp. NPDC052614]|uniref:helix-turn-helix domain-containing protein n=1 Tax=Thermopolyspora sp. NPDC052614 TaxID=3155682 RepID=UPI0034217BE1
MTMPSTRVSCAVFLDLLAREAAPVEFEEPVMSARAAGAPPEELAELERAKRAALRVHADLRRQARREAELTALLDLAGDLAGLRDLDPILEAIVRRARRLLNADVAYVTLNDDEHGETRMRMTDGSISAAFRRLRIPLGDGLGGLVAQTGMPYSSDRYLTDPQFRHRARIDEAVAEEALVAILGVPMRVGTRVIGVLYAANRTERAFSPEQAVLLGSLAAHAALAVDNARRLARTRTALAELNAANERVRAQNAAILRAAQAHDRMTALVVRGGGAEDVAAVVTEVLGGTLHVLDAGGRCLAASGEAVPLAEDEISGVLEIAGAIDSRGGTLRRGDLWITSVSTPDEVLGALVLRGEAELGDLDRRILERAALVTALLMLLRSSAVEAEARFRGELLDDLLDGRADGSASLQARIGRVGLEADVPYVVLSAHCVSPRHRGRAGFWAASYAAAAHGLAAVRDSEVVLLLPGDRPGETARQVAKEMGGSLGAPVTVGGAGPVRDLAGVPAAYREARSCADALLALDRLDDGADARELGFVGLLIGTNRDARGFLESTLGPVLDYDAKRGTSLVRTLDTYFSTGCGLAKTAERMHIHLNTVHQRLHRVERLLGEDWQEPERALEIQLALRLHRLRAPQR